MSDIKELNKKLRKSSKSVWEKRTIDEIENFCHDYKLFLKNSTNERRAISNSIKIAEKEGFVAIEEFLKNPPEILAGKKIYIENRGKSAAFFTLGENIEDGINMIASHVDAPRIDFKPVPLYEDSGFAFAKTHYYGGIKKYQWFSLPLGIDGIIIKNDGEKIDIRIGFEKDEPIFMISDLLPHLDRREGDISKVFTADSMNLILGNVRLMSDDEVKEPILLNVLKILNDKYGIVEEDLFSAELEIVPIEEPRDMGFDRSMIAAYGHDDRVCSYTALKALTDAGKHMKTSCVVLLDKEEIGSVGNTGARYHFWIKALKKLMKLYGTKTDIEDILENSMVLSGDVMAAYNPSFKDVHEINNTCKLGMGITITKYTGSRGKSGANDAHAEILASVRKIFNENEVNWQAGLLGKVDQGGGGTVALYFADKGMSVVDAGVPVLGMHAPYEIVSKADVYETYRGYKVFLEEFKGV